MSPLSLDHYLGFTVVVRCVWACGNVSMFTDALHGVCAVVGHLWWLQGPLRSACAVRHPSQISLIDPLHSAHEADQASLTPPETVFMPPSRQGD